MLRRPHKREISYDLVGKLKMIKGRGYEICNPDESLKEHKDETREDAAEDMADEELEEDP